MSLWGCIEPLWYSHGTLKAPLAIVLTPAGSETVGEALPLDDEAGDDPPEEASEEVVVSMPVALTPSATLCKRMKPPPSAAVVASPATPALATVEQSAEVEGADVSMAAPALRGPPAATTPFEVEADGDGGEEGGAREPSAKRQELSLRRVGDEELCHMDVESYEYIDSQVNDDISNNWVDDDIAFSEVYDDDNLQAAIGDHSESPLQEAAIRDHAESPPSISVGKPISDMQPELPADELGLIDAERQD